jgi:hypothetical protein
MFIAIRESEKRLPDNCAYLMTIDTKKTKIKITKVKVTSTGRSPRHTQEGHLEDTKQKP